MMNASLLDRVRTLAENNDLDDVVKFIVKQPNKPLPEDLAVRLAAVATEHGDVTILEHLANSGLDFKRAGKHGYLLLSIACKADRLEIAQWLLKRGLKLLDRKNDKGERFCSVLHFDANELPLRMVQFLVEGGAPVNVITELSGEFTTPVSRAHGWSRLDVINYLRSRGGRFPAELPEFNDILHDEPSYFDAPMSYGVEQKDLEAVRQLLDQWPGFNPASANPYLEGAARSGWIEGIAEFLRRGVDINGSREPYQRPIERAVEAEQWDTVRWLIDHGAEFVWSNNPQAARGWPSYCPFMAKVILAKQTDLVRQLIACGAPTHAASNAGDVFSALSLAIRSGNTELQALLRERGALEEHQVPGFVHPLIRGEKEWFASKTPDGMMAHFGVTRRNYLLYTYHCLSRLEVNRRDPRSRRFLERLLDRAENRCTEKDLAIAFDLARNCRDGAISYAFNDDEFQGCAGVAEIMAEGDDTKMNAILAKMADLLREIVGNPFRLRPEQLKYERAKLAQSGIACIEFAANWRTEKVIQLAASMYEKDDFTAMSALADALEHAGCTAPEILRHCRAGLKHVRGCWVVDLVLDKDQLPDLPGGAFRIGH